MSDALLDLKRAAALPHVFVTYGLWPGLRGRFRADPADDAGQRLRLALEALGMTYLKLGQYLAMRQDLVSEEVGRELQKLFEEVTPASFDEIRSVVEADLGGPLANFYPEFNREPIAAASVAQVHEARLHDGTRVAVKVQRPGVREIFYADIRNFRRFAALVDATGLTGTLDVRGVVDEFASWTERELDFMLEGATADRLRENALPFEHAPVIYWDLTTTRVLTMERIDGLSLVEIGRLFDAGGEDAVLARLPDLDLRLVLQRLATASLRQIFEKRFFHGDPHPGNIMIRPDNTVVYVDFGIFGELSPYEGTYLRRFVEAQAAGNIAESVHAYMKQVQPTPETDERAYRHAVSQVFRRWYEASRNAETSTVAERRLGRMAGEVLRLTRQYHLRMSVDTLLFWRAMDALDSSALRFPGYFDLIETMRDFFEPDSAEMVERLIDIGEDAERAAALASVLQDGPGRLSRTLQVLAEHREEWTVDLEESTEVFRTSNRRASLISAALMGLSMLVIGLASPFDVAIRAATLGIVTLLALWTVAQVRRR